MTYTQISQNKITLRKLLCKSMDRVVTEDKNKIVYEIDFSNYSQAVKQSTWVNLNIH